MKVHARVKTAWNPTTPIHAETADEVLVSPEAAVVFQFCRLLSSLK